jgi:hypothetical protein
VNANVIKKMTVNMAVTFSAFFGKTAVDAIIALSVLIQKGECFLKKNYTMEIVG